MLVEHAEEQKTKRSVAGRRIAIIAGGILLAALIVDFIVLSLNWPFTENSVRDALQHRSGMHVRIGTFHNSLFPPKCVAENVTFLPSNGAQRTPIITIQRLAIRGDYPDLLTFHRRVEVVHVVGMHVAIPPRGSGQRGGTVLLTGDKSSGSLQIGRIVADGAVLEFLPGAQGKSPYRIEVRRLKLMDVGAGAPMSYDATLINSLPPGEIHSTGKFGPWNPGNPSQTAVTGAFTFDHANLGVSKLVSGMLSSSGQFRGVLDHIDITGKTDIPDFHVSGSSHRVHLITHFHGVVNGTDGDTFLKSVQATFGRTAVSADGGIVGKAGHPGKTVELQLTVTDGRIDDLLRLFIEAKQAPMDGAISLRGRVTVPPGPQDFLKKLTLQGEFGIGGGRFTDANDQTPINRLSESAEGEKKKVIEEDPRTVLSNLKGHVSARNGIATLTDLSFDVPGAQARLHGTYNLINKRVDLHGVLATTGKLSDTTSGFKAIVVKAITPFYKKKHSLKAIPFRISGTYGHTSIGLDMGK